MNERIKKLIHEKPELFDYADIPSAEPLPEGYNKQMDELEPDWVKRRIAEVAIKRKSKTGKE